MGVESKLVNSLWSSFAAAADRRKAEPALDFSDGIVSFEHLHAAALRAAAHLVDLGVGAGDVVALQLPKRPVTYALMLGCLRLGVIYSPLDPNNPQARTDAMLARLKPKALFTTGAATNPHGLTIGMTATEPFATQIGRWPAALTDRIPVVTSATHPAYIMFTSGSTGEPKGAVMPQQGASSLMRWAGGLIVNADAQRFTAINPLHFDNSVFDFYCGLVSGATLVPIETSAMPNPSDWAARIAESRATVLFSVPTLLMLLDKIGALRPERLPDITTFLFGGEGYPIDQLRTLHARFGDRAQLINVYGPTETSCICASSKVDMPALSNIVGTLVSLGRMHAEFDYAVLDESGEQVAPGESGELWIGGANVGLGYYGNAEETERRFRQDPRQSGYRSIFYRSGDLVREDEHGALWFQGRKDNQIKIGGHRVELEEVDAATESLPTISRSLTVLVKGAAPQLVTAFEADGPVDVEALAKHLQTRLPVYMRPARLLQLAVLPTNANGKVDRLAIQRIADAAVVTVSHGDATIAPQTAAQVRAAWKAALGHDRFSDTETFFDLGGTSLALTRVHAELSAHRPDAISMTDLFAHPTIARIVAFLDPTPVRAPDLATADASRRADRQQAMLAQMRTRGARTKS